jgi:hypothetical protein
MVVSLGRSGQLLDLEAARAEGWARELVKQRERFILRTPETPAGEGASDWLTTAAADLDKGRQAYAELETELAVEALSRAMKGYLEHFDSLADPAPLHETIALLASVKNQSGEEAAALEDFRLLATLAPTYVLDEQRFPPNDRKVLSDLQEELAFSGPSPVKVTARGGPGLVWLDGRFMGVTPLSLKDVEPGAHTWLVRRSGRNPASGRVVLSGKSAKVQAALSPVAAGWKSALDELVVERTNLHPSVQAIASAASYKDELIAVTVEDSSSGPLAKVIRARPHDGILIGYREVPATGDWRGAFEAGLAELLDVRLDGDEDAVAAAPAPTPADESAESGDPGLWLTVAGVAGGTLLATALIAGGAVGAVYGIAAIEQASEPEPAPSSPSGPDPHEAARRRVILGF